MKVYAYTFSKSAPTYILPTIRNQCCLISLNELENAWIIPLFSLFQKALSLHKENYPGVKILWKIYSRREEPGVIIPWRCGHIDLVIEAVQYVVKLLLTYFMSTVEPSISWQSRDSISTVTPPCSFGRLKPYRMIQHSRNRVTWLSRHERFYCFKFNSALVLYRKGSITSGIGCL